MEDKKNNEWIVFNGSSPPFAKEVEVKYEDGKTSVDMWVSSGSYSCWWSKSIYKKEKRKVTHWRGLNVQ